MAQITRMDSSVSFSMMLIMTDLMMRTDPGDSVLEYLSRCLVLMTLRVGDQVSHVIPRGGKIKVVPCHRVTLPPLDFTGPADMRVRESNEYNYFHTLFIESC